MQVFILAILNYWQLRIVVWFHRDQVFPFIVVGSAIIKGGRVYSYIHVLHDKFLLKSIVFWNRQSADMNIWICSPKLSIVPTPLIPLQCIIAQGVHIYFSKERFKYSSACIHHYQKAICTLKSFWYNVHPFLHKCSFFHAIFTVCFKPKFEELIKLMRNEKVNENKQHRFFIHYCRREQVFY